MKMKQSIAVIMTVHNRKKTTLECLRNFYNCKNIRDYCIDFYMMDDGSTDGTAEAVSNEFPQIIIIHGDGNLFWNRGMYYCWEEAAKIKHDFYLWLNDDTMLFENALQVLFDDYNTADGMSIISGCCCDTETRSKVTYGGWKGGCLVEPNGIIDEVDRINGNFVLIPNAVFHANGNLDPYYHHSLGDWDYGIRAKKKGIRLYITSSYIGVCNRHDTKKCYNANVPLLSRIKYLYSPLGEYPWETFYYSMKEKNLFVAFKRLVSINLRCLLPRLKTK